MKRTERAYNHQYPTHREALWKFLLLAALLLGYFGYMSGKYNAATGASLALLTWSFFVLCTPGADGGYLLAFPARLMFGVRMQTTQVVAWALAVLVNVAMIHWRPEAYDPTFVTRVLLNILTVPWPNWLILVVSAVGTWMSIRFSDELLDVSGHEQRRLYHRQGMGFRLVLIVGLTLLLLLAYHLVLDSFNLELPN